MQVSNVKSQGSLKSLRASLKSSHKTLRASQVSSLSGQVSSQVTSPLRQVPSQVSTHIKLFAMYGAFIHELCDANLRNFNSLYPHNVLW